MPALPLLLQRMFFTLIALVVSGYALALDDEPITDVRINGLKQF